MASCLANYLLNPGSSYFADTDAPHKELRMLSPPRMTTVSTGAKNVEVEAQTLS